MPRSETTFRAWESVYIIEPAMTAARRSRKIVYSLPALSARKSAGFIERGVSRFFELPWKTRFRSAVLTAEHPYAFRCINAMSLRLQSY
jgi:hypothetical protein